MAASKFNFEELVSPVEFKLLGAKEKGIFFTQEVFGEGEKKNSKEKKKICVSNKRLYILNIQGKPPKLDLSLNLLAINELTSPSPDRIVLGYNIDQHSDKAKQVKLEIKAEACVEFLAAILSPLHSTIGKDAVARRLKVKLQGEGMQEKLDGIVEENVERVSQGCQTGSASEVYALHCDFFDIPFHDEIAWELENTYQTHKIRTLSLNHFDYFPTKDLVPLIRMLEYCPHFEGLSVETIKLCSETFDALIHLSKNCPNLHTLTLKGIVGFNSKLAQKLFSQGFATNPNCVLEKLDLTETLMEEKGIESLAASVQQFPVGLRELRLNGIGASSKNLANFSKHFTKHADIPNTLTLLDLSNNHFSSSSTELQAFLSFVASSNRLQELSLASTNIPFDQLFPALQRGCTLYLTSLNLSNNNKPAIGKTQSASPAMKQFFQTVVALKQLNLSNCKLSTDFVLQILEGLRENQSIFCLEVNLSQNDLGSGLKEIASAISDIPCIDSLDLSYTSLDSDFGEIIGRLLTSTTIKHLDISGNIKRHKSAAARVLEESNLDKECKLETLKINDCKLGENTCYILHGLIRNNHLKRIELSGNLMGPSSFRELVKLINNNCVLEAIEFDDILSAACITNIAAALENNFSIQEMPIHFKDLVKLKKENERGIDAALLRITKLLARNQSPLKQQQALGGIKKRIDLFIAEQQLILDKKIVELDEEIHLYDISNLADSKKELISKANNLKAKAGLVTTLCENFYSSKLETEMGSNLSDLINEQTKTSLMPQVVSYREKVVADMLEKLQLSLGDVIKEEQVEEIKMKISSTEHQNVLSNDILSVFSNGLTSNVNVGNWSIVESLASQTCEIMVRELDSMCQQISNLETSDFPKSPDRNTLGGTCRLKLAFSTSMKRHRVSYQTYSPHFDVDTKSMDSAEISGNLEKPGEGSGITDPIPAILHTNPSAEIIENTQNVQDDTQTEQDNLPKQGAKRFAKPKFMASLKGKKDEKDKKEDKEKKEDKKSKSNKSQRSGSATSTTIAKPEPNLLPDISTFNEVSKEATRAPDIDVTKSKPRGPARRPPRRRELQPGGAETAQESGDIFAELASTAVAGLENIPVPDKSQFSLDLADKDIPTEHSDNTGAAVEAKSPPPTSPRKPQGTQLTPVGMGPGLASVLQGGLGKAKLKASRSHENIFDDSNKEENVERKNSDRTARKIESHPIMPKPKLLPRPDSKILVSPEEKNGETTKRTEPQSGPIATESKPEDPVPTESKQHPIATESKEENPVTPESKQVDQIAAESKEEDPVAKESEQDDPIATQTKQDVPVATETKQEDPLATESEQDVQIATESEQDVQIATESQAESNPPGESSEQTKPESNELQKESTPNNEKISADVEEPQTVENSGESGTKGVENIAVGTEDDTVAESTDPNPDVSSEKQPMSPPVTARRPKFKTNEQANSPQQSDIKSQEAAGEETIEKEQIVQKKRISETVSPPIALWDGEIRKSPSVSKKPFITKDRLHDGKERDLKQEGADGEGKKPPVASARPPKVVSNKPAMKPLPTTAKPKLSNPGPDKVDLTDAKEKSDEVEQQPTPSEDKISSPTEQQPEIPSNIQTDLPQAADTTSKAEVETSIESPEILKSPPIKEKPVTPSKPRLRSTGTSNTNLLDPTSPLVKDTGHADSSKEVPDSDNSEIAAKATGDIGSDPNQDVSLNTPPQASESENASKEGTEKDETAPI